MPLPSPLTQHLSSLRALANRTRDRTNAPSAGTGQDGVNKSLLDRCVEVAVHTWDLGFTAFGGPPVHFRILHERFVEREKWVDEQDVGFYIFLCLSCLAVLRE